MANKFQFVSELADHTAHTVTRDTGSWKSYLNTAARLYRDNISGKLSRDYKQEQDQLKTVVETLGQEVIQQEQKKTNVRKFISIVEGMEEIGKHLATKMYGYGAEYGE